MENRKIYIVSETADNTYVQGLVQHLEAASYHVEPKKLEEIVPDDCGAAKCVLLVDMTTQLESKEAFIHELQSKNITRDVTIIPIITSATEQKVNSLLEAGAADVLSEEDGLEKAYIKLGQSIDSSLAPSRSDIDLTDTEAPKSDKEIRVLVVEDDVLLKNLLSTRLEQANIDFTFSTTGEDALDLAKDYQPMVILLDLMLPGRDGLDVLQELRQANFDIPVIIFSNRDEQADRERASALGASEYFVKAMTDLSDLVKAIERLAN